MKKIGILVALLALFVGSAQAQEDVQRVVLDQPSSPLEISQYLSVGFDRAITHSVNVKNITSREIIAYQMGLLSFSVFNEFLDRLGGYAIESLAPGEEKRSSWESRESNASLHYTAVAYVSKVRFADGEVWEANHIEVIMPQLREIAKSLEIDDLDL